MRFSASTLAAIALPGLASALSEWNGTFYAEPGCQGSSALDVAGSAESKCISSEGTTFTSISGYEDTPSGYCRFVLYSDSDCQDETAIYITDKGKCADYDGFKSFQAMCYH